MHEPSRRKLLSMAGLASVAGAAGGLVTAPLFGAETASPVVPTPRERIRDHYLPNVLLRTQDDQPVRFYDDLIKNKAVTINFFYAKCEEICPLVTANLAKVQRLLGDKVGRDIFMYSITLKPETDTPAALKRYAAMHKAQPGWTFLTGDPADVELLRQRLGFTNPSAKVDKDISQHIGNVRYGNEPLMLWAACPGQARPEWIVESITWVIRPEDTQAAISHA